MRAPNPWRLDRLLSLSRSVSDTCRRRCGLMMANTARASCVERGVDPGKIQAAQGFARVRLLDDAVEAIVVKDESKRKYLLLAGNVAKLYKANLPDPSAGSFAPICVLLAV